MSEELEYLGCSHEAARLLPWFVTGALAPEERERVQAHLADCDICATDEQRERRMYALLSEEGVAGDADRAEKGLQDLMARVDEHESAGARDESETPMPSAERPQYVRWLVAAIVIQAVGLGVLCTVLWDRADSELYDPRFTTLTSPASVATGSSLRVVFDPDATVAQVQQALAAVSATVTAGPSEAGVYTLTLSSQALPVGDAIRQLRANPKILFAEPQ